MVNNMAREIYLGKTLSPLNAPFGKFAALGITIMATMYLGKAKPEKENMNHLLSYLNDMGFQVLLNESN